MTMSRTDPTAALDAVLSPAAAAWLAAACAAAGDPAAVVRAFPAVGRRLGRGPLPAAPPAGVDSLPARPGPAGAPPPGPPAPAAAPPAADLHVWTVDDAGRARLLRAAGAVLDRAALGSLLDRLYTHGDAAERRGVLRALELLPLVEDGLPLVRDALRTNDLRLIAAAVAGTCARLLPAAEFDQAVLKCLFVGVPLVGVTALADRNSPRLARMVADFARERVAAGRDVPADAWLVLAAQPAAVTAAGLRAELAAPVPARRAAAARFFAGAPVAAAAAVPAGGAPVAAAASAAGAPAGAAAAAAAAAGDPAGASRPVTEEG